MGGTHSPLSPHKEPPSLPQGAGTKGSSVVAVWGPTQLLTDREDTASKTSTRPVLK